MEMTRVTAEHQAVLPDEVRAALGVHPGDTLVWQVDNGAVRVWKIDEEDMAFLKLADQIFAEEWLSPEDEEAFRDL